jgi:methylthioribose-1-phosphate isomerase
MSGGATTALPSVAWTGDGIRIIDQRAIPRALKLVERIVATRPTAVSTILTEVDIRRPPFSASNAAAVDL